MLTHLSYRRARWRHHHRRHGTGNKTARHPFHRVGKASRWACRPSRHSSVLVLYSRCSFSAVRSYRANWGLCAGRVKKVAFKSQTLCSSMVKAAFTWSRLTVPIGSSLPGHMERRSPPKIVRSETSNLTLLHLRTVVRRWTSSLRLC